MICTLELSRSTTGGAGLFCHVHKNRRAADIIKQYYPNIKFQSLVDNSLARSLDPTITYGNVWNRTDGKTAILAEFEI